MSGKPCNYQKILLLNTLNESGWLSLCKTKPDCMFSHLPASLTSVLANSDEMSRKKDPITAISSPGFFTSLWASYLQHTRSLELIPAQKQATFSSRAVSTVTVHIKAETVKLCAWECWEGCVSVHVHGGAQPDGHPTLVSLTHSSSFPQPSPLNLSPAPQPASSQSWRGMVRRSRGIVSLWPSSCTSNIWFQMRTTGGAPSGTTPPSSTSVVAGLVSPHWPPHIHNFHTNVFLFPYQEFKDVGEVVNVTARLWFVWWFVSFLVKRELFADFMITDWLMAWVNKRCFIYLSILQNPFLNFT